MSELDHITLIEKNCKRIKTLRSVKLVGVSTDMAFKLKSVYKSCDSMLSGANEISQKKVEDKHIKPLRVNLVQLLHCQDELHEALSKKGKKGLFSSFWEKGKVELIETSSRALLDQTLMCSVDISNIKMHIQVVTKKKSERSEAEIKKLKEMEEVLREKDRLLRDKKKREEEEALLRKKEAEKAAELERLMKQLKEKEKKLSEQQRKAELEMIRVKQLEQENREQQRKQKEREERAKLEMILEDLATATTDQKEEKMDKKDEIESFPWKFSEVEDQVKLSNLNKTISTTDANNGWSVAYADFEVDCSIDQTVTWSFKITSDKANITWGVCPYHDLKKEKWMSFSRESWVLFSTPTRKNIIGYDQGKEVQLGSILPIKARDELSVTLACSDGKGAMYVAVNGRFLGHFATSIKGKVKPVIVCYKTSCITVVDQAYKKLGGWDPSEHIKANRHLKLGWKFFKCEESMTMEGSGSVAKISGKRKKWLVAYGDLMIDCDKDQFVTWDFINSGKQRVLTFGVCPNHDLNESTWSDFSREAWVIYSNQSTKNKMTGYIQGKEVKSFGTRPLEKGDKITMTMICSKGIGHLFMALNGKNLGQFCSAIKGKVYPVMIMYDNAEVSIEGVGRVLQSSWDQIFRKAPMWKWSKCEKSIVLENGNLTSRISGEKKKWLVSYGTIEIDTIYDQSVRWTFRIDEGLTHFTFGLAPDYDLEKTTWMKLSRDSWVLYSKKNAKNLAGWIQGDQVKDGFGPPAFGVGDMVMLTVVCKDGRGTLYFSLNGICYGSFCDELYGAIFPVAVMYDKGALTITGECYQKKGVVLTIGEAFNVGKSMTPKWVFTKHDPSLEVIEDGLICKALKTNDWECVFSSLKIDCSKDYSLTWKVRMTGRQQSFTWGVVADHDLTKMKWSNFSGKAWVMYSKKGQKGLTVYDQGKSLTDDAGRCLKRGDIITMTIACSGGKGYLYLKVNRTNYGMIYNNIKGIVYPVFVLYGESELKVIGDEY